MPSLSGVRVREGSRGITCQWCIDVWFSMVSGHGAGLFFFDEEDRDWTFKALASPPPPTSDDISFLPCSPLGVMRITH